MDESTSYKEVQFKGVWEMKKFSCLLLILLSACISAEKKQGDQFYTFSSFETIELGKSASSDLEKLWGTPQYKDPYKIEGTKFTQWEYEDASRTRGRFLIDQKGVVVEKIFFPPPRSQESKMEYLLNEKFKDIDFQKNIAKCGHFGEFVYFNKSHGLFLISSEGKSTPVAAVAFGTPELVVLRNKEEQNLRCKW